MRSLLAGLALVALAACQRTPSDAEPSIKPGANKQFLDPELDVAQFTETFEGESREIAVARVAIAEALGLRAGMAVADVGAGTGLFLELLAERVGPEGKVYSLDIAPPFVEHLRQRASAGGWKQVEVRLCGERSIELPEQSIDLAFLCDVYHHFEYPRSTMASIRSALRPGGRVVIVDFERIPGVSRKWVLDHVRTGKEEVLAELASFGFELVEEVAIEGLAENYFLRLAAR